MGIRIITEFSLKTPRQYTVLRETSEDGKNWLKEKLLEFTRKSEAIEETINRVRETLRILIPHQNEKFLVDIYPREPIEASREINEETDSDDETEE